MNVMSEVTRILDAIEQGDPCAAKASCPWSTTSSAGWPPEAGREKPGQTLDATALVHEAYLRLVGANRTTAGIARPFLRRGGRGHAAIRSIRRRKGAVNGGAVGRIDVDAVALANTGHPGPVAGD